MHRTSYRPTAFQSGVGSAIARLLGGWSTLEKLQHQQAFHPSRPRQRPVPAVAQHVVARLPANALVAAEDFRCTVRNRGCGRSLPASAAVQAVHVRKLYEWRCRFVVMATHIAKMRSQCPESGDRRDGGVTGLGGRPSLSWRFTSSRPTPPVESQHGDGRHTSPAQLRCVHLLTMPMSSSHTSSGRTTSCDCSLPC